MDISTFEASASGGGEDKLLHAEVLSLLGDDLRYLIVAALAVVKHVFQLAVLVFTLFWCALLYIFTLSWLCLFWVQTRLFMVTSSILRRCMAEPRSMPVVSDKISQQETSRTTSDSQSKPVEDEMLLDLATNDQSSMKHFTETTVDVETWEEAYVHGRDQPQRATSKEQDEFLQRILQREAEIEAEIRAAESEQAEREAEREVEESMAQPEQTFEEPPERMDNWSAAEVRHIPQPVVKPELRDFRSTKVQRMPEVLQKPKLSKEEQKAQAQITWLDLIKSGGFQQPKPCSIENTAFGRKNHAPLQDNTNAAPARPTNPFCFSAEQLAEAAGFAAEATRGGGSRKNSARPGRSQDVQTQDHPVKGTVSSRTRSQQPVMHPARPPVAPTRISGKNPTAQQHKQAMINRDLGSPSSKPNNNTLPPHLRRAMEVRAGRAASKASPQPADKQQLETKRPEIKQPETKQLEMRQLDTQHLENEQPYSDDSGTSKSQADIAAPQDKTTLPVGTQYASDDAAVDKPLASITTESRFGVGEDPTYETVKTFRTTGAERLTSYEGTPALVDPSWSMSANVLKALNTKPSQELQEAKVESRDGPTASGFRLLQCEQCHRWESTLEDFIDQAHHSLCGLCLAVDDRIDYAKQVVTSKLTPPRPSHHRQKSLESCRNCGSRTQDTNSCRRCLDFDHINGRHCSRHAAIKPASIMQRTDSNHDQPSAPKVSRRARRSPSLEVPEEATSRQKAKNASECSERSDSPDAHRSAEPSVLIAEGFEAVSVASLRDKERSEDGHGDSTDGHAGENKAAAVREAVKVLDHQAHLRRTSFSPYENDLADTTEAIASPRKSSNSGSYKHVDLIDLDFGREQSPETQVRPRAKSKASQLTPKAPPFFAPQGRPSQSHVGGEFAVSDEGISRPPGQMSTPLAVNPFAPGPFQAGWWTNGVHPMPEGHSLYASGHQHQHAPMPSSIVPQPSRLHGNYANALLQRRPSEAIPVKRPVLDLQSETTFPPLTWGAPVQRNLSMPMPPGLGNARPGRQAAFDALLPDSDKTESHVVADVEAKVDPHPPLKLRHKAPKSVVEAKLKMRQITSLREFSQKFTLPESMMPKDEPQTGWSPVEGEHSPKQDLEANPPEAAPDFQPSRVQDDPDSENTANGSEKKSESAPTSEKKKKKKKKVREQKKAAREALKEAWCEREDARIKLHGDFSPDGCVNLKEANEIYNQKRSDLVGLMGNGQLNDEEAKVYPVFGDMVLSAPKARPDGVQELMQEMRRKKKEAKDAAATAAALVDEASKQESELDELKVVMGKAATLRRQALDYFNQLRPQSDIAYKDWVKRGEDSLRRATNYYRKKREELEAACPAGLPFDLQVEFPEVLG